MLQAAGPPPPTAKRQRAAYDAAAAAVAAAAAEADAKIEADMKQVWARCCAWASRLSCLLRQKSPSFACAAKQPKRLCSVQHPLRCLCCADGTGTVRVHLLDLLAVSELLQRLPRQVLHLADEKVNLASKIYDYVDQRIRRLDLDMAVFDEELARDRAKLGVVVRCAAAPTDCTELLLLITVRGRRQLQAWLLLHSIYSDTLAVLICVIKWRDTLMLSARQLSQLRVRQQQRRGQAQAALRRWARAGGVAAAWLKP